MYSLKKYLFQWVEQIGHAYGVQYIIRILCYKQPTPMEPMEKINLTEPEVKHASRCNHATNG